MIYLKMLYNLDILKKKKHFIITILFYLINKLSNKI